MVLKLERYISVAVFWGLMTIYSFLSAQTDTLQRWNYSVYADMFFGKSVLVGDNTDVGIDEIVSHHRLGELSLNTAIATVNYDDERIRFSAGLGAGTYFVKNLSAEPLGYRNIFQCYGGLKLVKNKEIWVDAGIMPSHIGYESAISMDQPTLTRSLVSDFSPYYETGVKISAQQTRFSGALLLLNGWQRMWRMPNDRTSHLGVQLNYTGHGVFINYSGYYGGLGAISGAGKRSFHDIYATFSIKENIKFWLLFDFGQDMNLASQKYWWGNAAVLQYLVNDRFSVSGRFERFVDPNNRIVSTSANLVNVTGYSINTDYRINDKVLVRIETKQLQATKAIFFNNGNTTFSKSSLLVMGSIAWKLKK